MQERRRNKFYVAFPGMGKTMYALHHAGVIDLDFGNYRSALGVDKSKDASLRVPFSKLCTYYWKDGFDVLTNEPSLIPYLKQTGAEIVVVVPKNYEAHVRRVALREEKRNVNASFPKELEQHIEEWVNDWIHIARRYGVKIQVSEGYFERSEDGNH